MVTCWPKHVGFNLRFKTQRTLRSGHSNGFIELILIDCFSEFVKCFYKYMVRELVRWVKCSDLSRHGGDGLVHWEDRSLLSSFSAVTFERGVGSLETCHKSYTPGNFHWRNWPWGFTVYVYLHTACLVLLLFLYEALHKALTLDGPKCDKLLSECYVNNISDLVHMDTQIVTHYSKQYRTGYSSNWP